MRVAGCTTWVWHTGRKRFNRVTVRERADCAVIIMSWTGKTISLRHKNRERAKAEAMEKSAEIARTSRRTHETDEGLMAIRFDLVRVAKLLGHGPGVAPSEIEYRRHGRHSDHRPRAAFSGYRKIGNSVNPLDGWGEAMRKFRLTPKGDLRCASYDLCAADVREVAAKMGDRRRLPERAEQDAHGQWTSKTVCKHLRVPCWTAVGDVLGLEVSRQRMGAAARGRMLMRRRHTHEQQGSRTGRAA